MRQGHTTMGLHMRRRASNKGVGARERRGLVRLVHIVGVQCVIYVHVVDLFFEHGLIHSPPSNSLLLLARVGSSWLFIVVKMCSWI